MGGVGEDGASKVLWSTRLDEMTVDDDVDDEYEYEVSSSTDPKSERPRHDDDYGDDVSVGKGWFDVYYVEEIESLCCLSRSGKVVTVRIPNDDAAAVLAIYSIP